MTACKQTVDAPDAKVQWLADGRTQHGIDRRCIDGVFFLHPQRALFVNGIAQAIDHPPQHQRADPHGGLIPPDGNQTVQPDTPDLSQRHEQCLVITEAYDLGRDRFTFAGPYLADGANRGVRTVPLYDQTDNLGNLAVQPDRFD